MPRPSTATTRSGVPSATRHGRPSISSVPTAGSVTARLNAAKGDWDVAIVDSGSGRVVAGSAYRGTDELASGLRRHGHPNVLTVDDEQELVETIASVAKPGDLVVGLGAGTITDWMNALPNKLAQGGRA